MKIIDIRTFLMRAGAPQRHEVPSGGAAAERMSGLMTRQRHWLFVNVYTDAGIVGIGECSGWPKVVETAVADLAPLLLGEDPADIERLWQKLAIALMGHGQLGTVGGGAMAGIDMALWDIKGKALGTPVWNLLGGKLRDAVPIYAHANDAESALALKAAGIRAIKCGGVSDPVRKVARLREAVGGDVDLMIDLHGPPWLTVADAIAVGRALEPYGLLFIEEPVAPEFADAYARIREHVAVPLAAGERAATIFGERHFIERDLVDVLQPDTGRVGGITQLKKIAAMAEAHGIMLAPHSGSLGPVAEYAALHVMAAIPNALFLERIENDWPGRQEIVRPHPVQVGGAIPVPTAPGLGVEIDEAAVARHPPGNNIGIPVGESAGSYAPGTWREHVYVQSRLRRGRYLDPGRAS